MGCTIDNDVLDYGPEFYRDRIVVARKEHKCNECGDIIPIGAQYEYVVGLWDRHFAIQKTCLTCKEIRDRIFCSGTFGEIWEDLMNEFRDTGLHVCQLEGLSKEAITKLSNYISEWLECEN